MNPPIAGRLAPDRKVALLVGAGGRVVAASPFARTVLERDPVGSSLAEAAAGLGARATSWQLPASGAGPDALVAAVGGPPERAPCCLAAAVARVTADGWEPTWACPELGALLGASPDGLPDAGRVWEASVVLADRPVHEAAWRERIVAGRSAARYRVAGLDGRVRAVEDHAWLVEPGNGPPLAVQVIFEARSEERAAPSGDGLTRMARALGDLVLVLDVDRDGVRRIDVADGDPRAVLALPAAPGSISPTVLAAALEGDGRERLDAHAARLLASGADETVLRLRGADDECRVLWIQSHAVRRGAGSARAVTTVSRIDAILAALEHGEEGPLDVAALTPRQREALVLLAQGLSNQEIAELLDVAPGTVGKLLGAVFARLGVRGRAEAAQVARRLVAS